MAAIDPIAGDGACATVSAADQGDRAVSVHRRPAGGCQSVIRHRDHGRAGVYRLDSSAPDGLQGFQLHPGVWHFAAGHIPKLELLGQDSPYVRTSNGQFSISVSGLQLHLPVHEAPDTAPGVNATRPPVQTLAHGCLAAPYSRIARPRAAASPVAVTVH